MALSFEPRHAGEYDQEHLPHEAQMWEDDEWSVPHRGAP